MHNNTKAVEGRRPIPLTILEPGNHFFNSDIVASDSDSVSPVTTQTIYEDIFISFEPENGLTLVIAKPIEHGKQQVLNVFTFSNTLQLSQFIRSKNLLNIAKSKS